MNFFYAIVRKVFSLFCRIWNCQYYQHTGISSGVVFSAAFPGIVRIISPQHCRIGNGSVINSGSVIHCAGGVSIGNYVHIGHGFCAYSTNHNYASNQAVPYDTTDLIKSVEIGDCVWIGSNVSIVPGVKIGEGAVVGMGAVVTRNIPVGAIVGGNPAQIIGYRDMETYWRLKTEGKFS